MTSAQSGQQGRQAIAEDRKLFSSWRSLYYGSFSVWHREPARTASLLQRKRLNFDDPDASRDLALVLAEIQDAKDSVVLLVRGAIILDNLMNELLERALHFENSVRNYDKKYRLFFAGKCDLALAAGVLSRQECSVLRVFNNFRNRAAHGLDVHVHDDEIRNLHARLKEYGWEPLPGQGNELESSPLEVLRDILFALVGLLVERIARTNKVTVTGHDLDAYRWKKVTAMGIAIAIMTISRERVMRDRRDKAHTAFQEALASLEGVKWATSPPSNEEYIAALNQRLNEQALPVEAITAPIVKALEPLLKRVGARLTIATSLDSISITREGAEELETGR